MDESITLDAVLKAINGLTLRAGLGAEQRAEFGRLYAFYQEMEATPPDSSGDEEPAARRRTEPEAAAPSQLDIHLRQQAAARERYGQRIDFFLLLKSFYNAFILPLEQDLAIVQSCRALGIRALTLPREETDTDTTLLPQAYDLEAARRNLATAQDGFAEIGRLLFPNAFALNDFTDPTPQDQAG